MKIFVVNGSPRGENGNTHIMVNAFLQGAEKAGAETENVFLMEKKISPCLGCFACWLKTPGQCVHNDDMAELQKALLAADIIVFAFPLYVDNVPGIMKNFMDRLIPLLDPHFEQDAQGECRHMKRYEKYPKIMVMSNCGFPEMSHFQVVQLLFQRIARNMHSQVIAEIYRPAGEILRHKNPALLPFLLPYKKLLKKVGKAIVEQGAIPDDLQEKLNKPLIPEAMYIKVANQNFSKMLEKLEKE